MESPREVADSTSVSASATTTAPTKASSREYETTAPNTWTDPANGVPTVLGRPPKVISSALPMSRDSPRVTSRGPSWLPLMVSLVSRRCCTAMPSRNMIGTASRVETYTGRPTLAEST